MNTSKDDLVENESNRKPNIKRIGEFIIGISLPLIIITIIFLIFRSANTGPGQLFGPTFTPGRESLLPETSELCQKSFITEIGSGRPSKGTLTLLTSTYIDSSWELYNLSTDAKTVDKVRTLVCIRESRYKTGFYTDYSTAYDRIWEVRLVEWPSGKLMSKHTLVTNPPVTKGNSDGYGERPGNELIAWLEKTLGEQMSLVHPKDVICAAFSPDGKILASGLMDGTVRLWGIPDAALLKTLEGSSLIVSDVTFSTDGTILAVSSFDGSRSSGDIYETVRLYKVSDGTLLIAMSGQSVGRMKISPDGTMLASVPSGHTIQLWRISDGSLVRTIDNKAYGIIDLAFSSDGTTLTTVMQDQLIQIKVSDGTIIKMIFITSHMKSAALSEDGSTLAIGLENGIVQLLRVSDGKLLLELKGHEREVNILSFSRDGKTLASGSLDYSVRLWRISDGMLLRMINKQPSMITNISFSPDGTILAIGYADILRLWDIA
jgi:WD40 repeat protein